MSYILLFNIIILGILSNNLICDAPQPWQIGFQDSATPGFSGIVELHNTIFFYLIVICVSVFWMLAAITYNFNNKYNPIIYKYLNHGTFIELVWTISPALVLIAIAFPSFRLLYVLDEVISVVLTIKVIGHQWYWSYEYSDYITENGEPIEFDSYMVPDSDLELGQLRLLEVDNSAVVPVDCHVRVIVTADDVLHDFAVPSLGLKIDATPGRLNQASFIVEREGIFKGMCSELCGPYHDAMPIEIKSVSTEAFLNWANDKLEN
jgi:cytochrome c oxidase subunit 2